MPSPAAPPPPLSPPAWIELLARELPAYGVALEAEAIERLARFGARIAECNRRIRLVGDAAPETLARRHIGESLYLAATGIGDLRRTAHLVDVGSGAGFPGLVLALANPGLKTTLVESTLKKARFLSETVTEIGVKEQVTVAARRLEEMKLTEFHSPAPDLYVCRALERMETIPARLAPRVRAGVRAAFWVSGAMAKAWRAVAEWRWSEPALIPGSQDRYIVGAVRR